MSIKQRLTDHVTAGRLRLEVQRAARPLAVVAAAFVATAFALSYIFGNVSGGSDIREIRVAVADATGVVAGRSEVRVLGITAKTHITDVEPRAGGGAVLTLEVPRDLGAVHRDARLALRPNTPLQDMYVDVLDPGTPRAGELGGSEVLPIDRTATGVNVADVLQVLQPDVRADLGAMLRDLGGSLEDHGRTLRQAFVELMPFVRIADRVAAQVGRREAQTRRLVHSTTQLTAALGDRDAAVRRLAADGGATLDQLGRSAGDLERSLQALPITMERLDRSFTGVRAVVGDVDTAVTGLLPVADRLGPGLDAVRSLSGAAAPAVRALDEPVRRLRPLSRSLQPVATQLRSALDALAPQVPAVDRVITKVAGCGYAIQRFFHWTSSVFKLGDAHGPGPRADVTLGVESSGALRDPRNIRTTGCAPGLGKGATP